MNKWNERAAHQIAEGHQAAKELNVHRALVAVLVDKLGGSVKVSQAEMQQVALTPGVRYEVDVKTGDVTISHGVIITPE